MVEIMDVRNEIKKLEQEIVKYKQEVSVYEERIKIGGSIYRDMNDTFIPWDKHVCDENGTPTFKSKDEFETRCRQRIQRAEKEITKVESKLKKIRKTVANLT